MKGKIWIVRCLGICAIAGGIKMLGSPNVQHTLGNFSIILMLVAGGAMLCVFGDMLARVLLFTNFERCFEIEPVTRKSELWSDMQNLVNDRLVLLAGDLGGMYEVQKQDRNRQDMVKITPQTLRARADELDRISRKVGNRKASFYSARDAAWEEGFFVFASYRPYLSNTLVRICTNPLYASEPEQGDVEIRKSIERAREYGEQIPQAAMEFIA